MSEQQITIDSLLGRVGHYVNSRESLSARDVETLRELFEFFATQQRADAAQQLQRENAELDRKKDYWRYEAKRLLAELAAAKQQLAEAEMDVRRLKGLLEDILKYLNPVGDPPSILRQQDRRRLDAQIREALGEPIARTAQAGAKSPWTAVIPAEQKPSPVDTSTVTPEQAQAAWVYPECAHPRRTTHKSILEPGVERDRCIDCGEVLLTGAQAGEKQDD